MWYVTMILHIQFIDSKQFMCIHIRLKILKSLILKPLFKHEAYVWRTYMRFHFKSRTPHSSMAWHTKVIHGEVLSSLHSLLKGTCEIKLHPKLLPPLTPWKAKNPCKFVQLSNGFFIQAQVYDLLGHYTLLRTLDAWYENVHM